MNRCTKAGGCSVPRTAADVYRNRPSSLRERGEKAAVFSAQVIDTIRNLGTPGWSDYGSMYRAQPAVRSVVDFLARNIAQLNPKTYERLGNTDRLEVGEHPLAHILRHPNPDTTRYRHMRDTVADIAIYDRAYWLKMRAGSQVRVLRLAPSRMMVNDVGGRYEYRYVAG